MKRLMKRLFALLVILVSAVVFATGASATALISGARWCHMASVYNGTDYVNSCVVTVSTSNLSRYWAGSYNSTRTIPQQALYNFHNNTSTLLRVANVPYGSANIDLQTYAGTQAQWNITYGSTTLAFTVLYNKEGEQYSFGKWGGDVTLEEFGDRIDSAVVCFSPNYTGEAENNYANKDNLVRVIEHEIGHCINLDHPGEGYYNVPAVMQPAFNHTWSTYPLPTSYDLTLIRSLYTQIYS